MSESASGEATGSSTAADKEFSCDACGSTHNSQRALSIHETKKHGGPVDGDGVDCPGCERRYSSQRGLIEHLTSGCNDAGHECPDCGRTHPTERGLAHHRKETHGIDTRPVVECAACGDGKQLDPNHANQSEHHFCDYECFSDWYTGRLTGEDNPTYQGGDIELVCEICGDDYEVNPAREDSVVCGPECRYEYVSKHYSGENSGRWKGGSVRHYGDNWHQQRRKALERDGWRCQYCGEDMSDAEREPDVHHIKRLKWFEDNYDAPEWWERGNRLENLVTACRPCHNQWEGIPVKPELD